METKRKPTEVLLTDHPGWGSWDAGGELMDQADRLASEIYDAVLSDDTCDMLVMDLAGPLRKSRRSKQDWSGRSISWEDAALVCAGLKRRAPGLELTQDAILSTIRDAYEEALTPTDRDITDALEAAIETMADNFEIDEDFWSPLLDQGADAGDIVRGLLEHTADGVFVDRHVAYRRKPGSYDRSLVFDLWSSDVVKAFLKALPDDYDMKATLHALEGEFQSIITGFLSRFFSALSKEMSSIDVQNRADWRRAWKDMIAGIRPPGGGAYEVGHEPTLEKIRKEMLIYLDTASEEDVLGDEDEDQAE